MTWNVLTTWHVTLSRMLGTWHDSPPSMEHSGLISQQNRKEGKLGRKLTWRLTTQSSRARRKTVIKVKFVTDMFDEHWATRFLSWRHLTLAPLCRARNTNQLFASQASQAADQCWFCSEIDLGLWKMDSVPWWMRDTQPVITPVELAVAEIVFNYW